MKCPYCNKGNCFTWLITANVENYGSGVFIVNCLHCAKKIKILAQRQAVVISITKATEHEEYSF